MDDAIYILNCLVECTWSDDILYEGKFQLISISCELLLDMVCLGLTANGGSDGKALFKKTFKNPSTKETGTTYSKSSQ